MTYNKEVVADGKVLNFGLDREKLFNENVLLRLANKRECICKQMSKENVWKLRNE